MYLAHVTPHWHPLCSCVKACTLACSSAKVFCVSSVLASEMGNWWGQLCHFRTDPQMWWISISSRSHSKISRFSYKLLNKLAKIIGSHKNPYTFLFYCSAYTICTSSFFLICHFPLPQPKNHHLHSKERTLSNLSTRKLIFQAPKRMGWLGHLLTSLAECCFQWLQRACNSNPSVLVGFLLTWPSFSLTLSYANSDCDPWFEHPLTDDGFFVLCNLPPFCEVPPKRVMGDWHIFLIAAYGEELSIVLLFQQGLQLSDLHRQLRNLCLRKKRLLRNVEYYHLKCLEDLEVMFN